MKAFIAILLVAAVSGQMTTGVDKTNLRQLYLQGQYQRGGRAGLFNTIYGTGVQGGLGGRVGGDVYGTGVQGGVARTGLEGLIYGNGFGVYGKGFEGLYGKGLEGVYGKGLEGVYGKGVEGINGVYGGLVGDLTTEKTGFLYTLGQLYELPIFQEYLTLPLFRQYFTVPAFQRFLVSEYFQKYFTLPIFQEFFRNPVLFYKFVFPVVRQFELGVFGGVEKTVVVPEIYRHLVPEIYRTGVVPTYSGVVPEVYNGRVLPVGYTDILRSLIAGGLTGRTGVYGNGITGNTGIYGNTGLFGINRFLGNTNVYGNGLVRNTFGVNGIVGNKVYGNTGIYGTVGKDLFGQTGIYGKGVEINGEVYPVEVLDRLVKGLLGGVITVDQLHQELTGQPKVTLGQVPQDIVKDTTGFVTKADNVVLKKEVISNNL